MKFFNQMTKRSASTMHKTINFINNTYPFTKIICENNVPPHGAYSCSAGSSYSPQRWQTHIHDEISKIQAKSMVDRIKKEGGVPKVEVIWHCEEEIDEAGIGTINTYKWRVKDIEADMQEELYDAPCMCT